MQSRTRMAFAFAAALLALASQAFALDDEHWQKANDAIKKGLAHLRTTQAADGSWIEPEVTGTGFPRVFYLRYDMYRNNFPLMALATFRKGRGGWGRANRRVL